jgi:hypothetical protein
MSCSPWSDTADTEASYPLDASRSLAGDALPGRREEGMRIAPGAKVDNEGNAGGTGAMVGGGRGTGMSTSGDSEGASARWARNLSVPLSSPKCWQSMSNWLSSSAGPIANPPSSVR